MRTNRMARFVAILVAILAFTACGDKYNITQVNNTWLPIGTPRTDTTGTCVATRTIYVNDVDQVSGGGSVTMNVSDTKQLAVREIFNPTGCGKHFTFRWLSENTSIVTVTKLDSITARIAGISAGTTPVWAIAVEDSTFRLKVNVTVIGVVVPPTGTISWDVASVCMSTASGQPTTRTITITTSSGMPVPTVTSSNTAIFTVTGPTSTSGQVTTWTLTRVGVGNGNVTATAGGVTSSRPVQVLSTACPGTTSTIDYAPAGGSVPDSLTLTATCVVGSGDTACEPYWTSSDPSRIMVRGTTTKVVGGMTFYVGTTATLKRIATGSAEICVQWSLTRTTPAKCYTWQAP